MFHRQYRRRIILSVGLGVLAVLLLGLYVSILRPTKVIHQPISRVTTLHANHTVSTVSYRGLPAKLEIPAINLSTSFEFMGLTKNGDMVAPTDPNNVGWYKYGAIPGDPGSAVVAGHVDSANGKPAVFANLAKLQAGNLLLVTDSKGQIATFTVREVRIYDQQAAHDEVFTSATGTHLNIITCAGDWNSTQHQYRQRLVVFADLSPTP